MLLKSYSVLVSTITASIYQIKCNDSYNKTNEMHFFSQIYFFLLASIDCLLASSQNNLYDIYLLL
jgi:hypothetical protein